ncbi:hypothetical protein K1719_026882 [Acacia pycnantha]|nr:hypothetical protein K1719_026882 [Acacia pycnantha]
MNVKDLEPHKRSVKSYLGRPWKDYPRTVIMKNNIDNVIDPTGWHYWEDKNESKLNIHFVRWRVSSELVLILLKELTGKALRLLRLLLKLKLILFRTSFLAQINWLPAATGFPYTLGL